MSGLVLAAAPASNAVMCCGFFDVLVLLLTSFLTFFDNFGLVTSIPLTTTIVTSQRVHGERKAFLAAAKRPLGSKTQLRGLVHFPTGLAP